MKLTDKQSQVCELICKGLNNEEIAGILKCTTSNVKDLITRINKVLGTKNRTSIALTYPTLTYRPLNLNSVEGILARFKGIVEGASKDRDKAIYDLIEGTLRKNKGNIRDAAFRLGISASYITKRFPVSEVNKFKLHPRKVPKSLAKYKSLTLETKLKGLEPAQDLLPKGIQKRF